MRKGLIQMEVFYRTDAELQKVKDWIEAPITEEERKELSALKEKMAEFNRNYNEEEGIIRFEPKK